jgi:hypothetical protein
VQKDRYVPICLFGQSSLLTEHVPLSTRRRRVDRLLMEDEPRTISCKGVKQIPSDNVTKAKAARIAP